MQPTPQDRNVDDDGAGAIDDGAGVDNGTRSAVGSVEAAGSVEGAAATVVPDLGVLDGLTERPPHEHVAVYEQVHAQLQSALSEIDDA